MEITIDATRLRSLVFAPQKLREARLRKFPKPQWSLRRIATLLDITPQTLSEYELGKCKPSPDQLARMCWLYGVELKELTQHKLAA